jgi:hypothetical protein
MMETDPILKRRFFEFLLFKASSEFLKKLQCRWFLQKKFSITDLVPTQLAKITKMISKFERLRKTD